MTHPGPTEVYHGGSASFRKLNPHLVAGQVLAEPYAVKGEPYEVAGIKRAGGGKRLRQKSGDGLNKTEREFLDYLRTSWPGAKVGSQRIRLKLANGAWYKPDNDVLVSNGHIFYEVKGYMRPKDALTIKVAAKEFPEWVFLLVTKRRKKDGAGWDIEEVLK